jgi:hypothetical protein
VEKTLITLNHLDPQHTDLELVEEWNLIYDLYGCQIPQLKERWERENGLYKRVKSNTEEEFKFIPKPKVLELINKVPMISGLG